METLKNKVTKMMNKPTFRALREEVGVSHSDLAHMFKVHPSSVKRWEDESYSHTAPVEVVNTLLELLDKRDKLVENALTKAEIENVETVRLPYYRNTNSKENYKIKLQNADTRAVAKELIAAGVTVTLFYA